MIKREITYVNYLTDAEETELAYFHLNKADMIRIIGRKDMDWESYVKSVMDSKDSDAILDLIEEVVSASYGTKGEDGRTFVKDRAEQKRFVNSEPYAELLTEFILDSAKAEAFFKGVIGKGGVQPKEMAAKRTRSKK